MMQLFPTVGFGQWLRYFTGTLEVVSAVLLLMPPLAPIGAALLALTMACALVAHSTVLPFSPAKADHPARDGQSSGALPGAGRTKVLR